MTVRLSQGPVTLIVSGYEGHLHSNSLGGHKLEGDTESRGDELYIFDRFIIHD